MDIHLEASISTYYAPISNNKHHFEFKIGTPENVIVMYGDQVEFEKFAGELVEAVLAAKFNPCVDCISRN